MSAFPPKADMCGALANVCFGPKADITRVSIPEAGKRLAQPILSCGSQVKLRADHLFPCLKKIS
jgi:hypothetical protein